MTPLCSLLALRQMMEPIWCKSHLFKNSPSIYCICNVRMAVPITTAPLQTIFLPVIILVRRHGCMPLIHRAPQCTEQSLKETITASQSSSNMSNMTMANKMKHHAVKWNTSSEIWVHEQFSFSRGLHACQSMCAHIHMQRDVCSTCKRHQHNKDGLLGLLHQRTVREVRSLHMGFSLRNRGLQLL